jgi:alginate O-acetyltransferase complex protein AlgI
MNTAAEQLARPRTQALRLAAWLAGPAAIAGVHFALIDVHPIARMWALVIVLFFWMKATVLVERDRAGKQLPRPFAAWLLLWPGMRPVARAASPRQTTIVQGLASVALGTVMALATQAIWVLTTDPWPAAPFALAACSLILHYGLFALLTAAWRAAGFSAGPLFRNPFAARSLADFWGRRWNLAYVEMCQETILRAAKGKGTDRIVGPTLTSFGVFLFSGLLHEVAISLPVNAGYGLPTLYFVLNGGAMLIGRRLREGGMAARAWAAFWVIAPLPLVFHPWFVRGIVLPIAGIYP